jgi:hypothetical protein
VHAALAWSYSISWAGSAVPSHYSDNGCGAATDPVVGIIHFRRPCEGKKKQAGIFGGPVFSRRRRDWVECGWAGRAGVAAGRCYARVIATSASWLARAAFLWQHAFAWEPRWREHTTRNSCISMKEFSIRSRIPSTRDDNEIVRMWQEAGSTLTCVGLRWNHPNGKRHA